jgi:predicted enzyme related to lactoylglutathione lyase
MDKCTIFKLEEEIMNRVIGFEISSQDAVTQSKFYANVFGWEIGEPNWGYYPAKTGPSDNEGINGGISRTGAFPGWCPLANTGGFHQRFHPEGS